jgi:NADH dehydrogenase
MAAEERTDVLIIGGGFGGVNAARRFDRLLWRKLNAKVTLISRTNFYLFTPLLAEVAAALVDSLHAVNPVRRMFKRVRFVQGTVHRLDAENHTVEYIDENGDDRTLRFEHCVLAPGSVTAFFGIRGLEEDAFTMKTMGDAIQVRNHIVSLLERADALPPGQREHLLRFAVVGGGLNGTEVAGELYDFILRATDDYPTLSPDEVHMVLVEMRDRLAQELPDKVGDYCQRNLESRGMEVWLNARVDNYENGVLSIADGRNLTTETVIWSAGVRPAPLIADVEGQRLPRDDRLPTNDYLQVRGYDRIWAIGDAAAIPDGDSGDLMPPTAQHAVREGRHVANNVYRAVNDKPLKPFRYSSKGMLATLGRYRGAGRVFGIPLVGFLAWFAWRTYYLLALPRWDRRFRVVIDWTLNLVFPPDIVQIKVERLHPQAGADLGVTRRQLQRRRPTLASEGSPPGSRGEPDGPEGARRRAGRAVEP